MILFIVGSLICRVGILDHPASDAGDVISLLTSHMLDSSTPSIHCAQYSALVCIVVPSISCVAVGIPRVLGVAH
jgi:hypothetical protein